MCNNQGIFPVSHSNRMNANTHTLPHTNTLKCTKLIRFEGLSRKARKAAQYISSLCKKQAKKKSTTIFCKINCLSQLKEKKVKSSADQFSQSRSETLIQITVHREKLSHCRDFQLHNAESELCLGVTWLPASMDEPCNTPLSCSSCEKRILLFQEMALILETFPVTQKSIISTLSPGILSRIISL